MQQSSLKAAISSGEMAELCQLSRSRFFSMVKALVFPKPVSIPSGKRPIYDQDLQQKCLDIRRTGIGLHGHPVVFNRKLKKRTSATKSEPQPKHVELIDALGELGLKTDSMAVASAITTLFPAGIDTLDQGKVLQKLFRHLKGRP